MCSIRWLLCKRLRGAGGIGFQVKQMSRCPWCRGERGELVELDGRMVCRSCEELIGGSVLLRLFSPFPETVEPEYDQYVAVSTEIQDPSSGSAPYVSDEVWARLIVEICTSETSEWSAEADRPDEIGLRRSTGCSCGRVVRWLWR